MAINFALLLSFLSLSCTLSLTQSPTKLTSFPTTLQPTSQKPTEASMSPTTQKPTEASLSPTTRKPTEASKSPTQKPTEASLSPTTRKPTEASKSPTTKQPTEASLSPTTRKPTEISLSPTTRKPTEASMSPTTSKPTTTTPSTRPTKSPSTSQPTSHPTIGPSQQPTTGKPSITKQPTTAAPTDGPLVGGCMPSVNGHVYNFTSLRAASYLWTDPDLDWKYTFTFCGAPACGSKDQATLCQASTFLPLSYSLGTWKETQVWGDGGNLSNFAETSIQTTFRDGSLCDLTNSSRSTTVYLICRPNVTAPSLINVTVSPSCGYTALVTIPYSLCPPPPTVPEPLLNAWQISLIIVGTMFVLGVLAFYCLREVHEPEFST